MQQRLQGKIAVVTGASRGGGRGIAQILGEEGATVYVTGRTSRTNGGTHDRPECIEETAELVTARGGVGIPVRCDHTDDADVAALFRRIGAEQGRLDILVNNVWGGEEGYNGRNYDDGTRFGDPFWQPAMTRWDRMVTAGARAHLTASREAVPLMLPQGHGLIICTCFHDRGKYLGNVFYDLGLNAISRLAYGMAHDLGKHGIASVAVTPGFMRTERVMANVSESWDQSRMESTEYIGRAVAALAGDPAVMEKSGSTLTAGDLAQEYGFTDTDGRYIPAFHID